MFGPNSDPKYPHILFVNIAIILLIHHATPSLIGLNASWMVKTQALMSSVGTPRVSYLGEDPDSCGVRGMTFGFHQTSILVWKCCIPKWILKWLFSRENGLINQYTSVNLEPIFQPSRCTKPFVPTSRQNEASSAAAEWTAVDPKSPESTSWISQSWRMHDSSWFCMLEEKGERLPWQRKETGKWRCYFEPVDCAINRNQSSSGCDLPLLVDDCFDGDTIQYTLGLSSSIHHQNYRRVMKSDEYN